MTLCFYRRSGPRGTGAAAAASVSEDRAATSHGAGDWPQGAERLAPGLC